VTLRRCGCLLRCLSACKCQRSQYTSLPPSRQALRARAPACPHISPCPLCLFVPMSLCLSVPISLSLSRGCPAARHGRVRAINQYRGSSLIRKLHPLGPYSRPMPRALSWSLGGGHFLMREAPLYRSPNIFPRTFRKVPALGSWRSRGKARQGGKAEKKRGISIRSFTRALVLNTTTRLVLNTTARLRRRLPHNTSTGVPRS